MQGCTRAASGDPTAASSGSAMNSRRLIAIPEARDRASCRFKLAHWNGLQCRKVRFGSLADIAGRPRHVSSIPKSGQNAEPVEQDIPPFVGIAVRLAAFARCWTRWRAVTLATAFNQSPVRVPAVTFACEFGASRYKKSLGE